MMPISLLGSTGSIGVSTLDVVRKFPDRFSVCGLAAGGNIELLASQVREFRPGLVALANSASAGGLRELLGPEMPEILTGPDASGAVACMSEAAVVVAAIAGSAGLVPTYKAVAAGKTVALANKETLVMAGSLIAGLARSSGSRIIPVDSEHSAIFQLLEGRRSRDVRRLILTASGGPFRGWSRDELSRVTPEQALNHPRWKMGRKVTTDSATMMNKGLEIIEAHWLFGMPPEKIDVLVHPQSIVHSMVEFNDGTLLAQMSRPDMRGPIAYALSAPERLDGAVAPLDFTAIGPLQFYEADRAAFPSVDLAYRALAAGGLMPAAMNAANEIAVDAFHDGLIRFTGIAEVTEAVMNKFAGGPADTLDAVLAADSWARAEARAAAEKTGH